VARQRKVYAEPFNRNIPPLFSKGGILYKQQDIGTRIGFMVEMPEEHFTYAAWSSLHRVARRELADFVFIERRTASDAELSQLDWLLEAGHKHWWADKEYPRCNLNRYIEQLEKKIKEKK
jgi:hypothetical protein